MSSNAELKQIESVAQDLYTSLRSGRTASFHSPNYEHKKAVLDRLLQLLRGDTLPPWIDLDE